MKPLYRDNEAIDFLASHATQFDAGASSHWRRMHERFPYRDGHLDGLRGFGGYTSSRHWLKGAAHRALQWPFRAMGSPFPAFLEADEMTRTLAERQGRVYDLDGLRQALTWAFLCAKLPGGLLAEALNIGVIGDGFGMFSSLALAMRPGARVVLANLTQTLLVDLIYLRRAHPELSFGVVTGEEGMSAALADSGLRLVAMRADDFRLLSAAPLNLAVNIASMQEMAPHVIADYFGVLRSTPGKRPYFYCCNRVDKNLDGIRVRFADYPWSPADQILVDELCPWHQRYYSPLPPFYRPFAGPVHHRLVHLASPNAAATAETRS